MKIGVLAAQGAFIEHINVLRRLNIDASPVRLPRELDGLDGIILPGGESTTITLLMGEYGLADAIKRRVAEGLAVFGTCAGLILIARELPGSKVVPLGLMDIAVERNAYGRQRESFEVDLAIPALGEKPFPAVFIRAPVILRTGVGVKVLAQLNGGMAVAVRQGKLLGCSFHPELTSDTRFHQYFLDIISSR